MQSTLSHFINSRTSIIREQECMWKIRKKNYAGKVWRGEEKIEKQKHTEWHILHQSTY
uniref:Uncharacterized protein n=1 Tax=Rhizophora mucronata TaxID=61149 RepID=A0A2P2IZ07_RHIMU